MSHFDEFSGRQHDFFIAENCGGLVRVRPGWMDYTSTAGRQADWAMPDLDKSYYGWAKNL